MTLITTKSLKNLSDKNEQTLVLRPGGNALTTYYQAVELLERRYPVLELVSPLVTCTMQENNVTHFMTLKISLENSLVSDIKVVVFLYGEQRIEEFTLVEKESIEFALNSKSVNLIKNNNIKVVITGLDLTGKELEFIKDFKVAYSLNCNTEEITPSCISNSSQVLYKVERIGNSYKIKINNDPIKVCTTVQEFITYLASKGLSINFYVEVR